MKKIVVLVILLVNFAVSAQEIIGDWYGTIEISAIKLGFVIHISDENGVLKSTLDIPEQMAKGIPMTSTSFENNKLKIISAELRGDFDGNFENERFKGIFSQNGGAFPFAMSREVVLVKERVRPQEPKPKFNYKIENVVFNNTIDHVKLAGTLTMPKGKGPFPTVVLVSGSGPQDRNEEILGHKPFWVIADYLTNNGIAVLRYDDRGVGESTGDFGSARSVEFANDAQAAVHFLMDHKKVDKSKIGIVGHSEGAIIAPMVAGKANNHVAFLVLLAGPSIPGTEILLRQQELISAAAGESQEEISANSNLSIAIFQFINENIDSPKLEADLKIYLIDYMGRFNSTLPDGLSKEKMSDILVNAYCTPWMKYFLFYDPQYAFLKVTCPVLALNGSKDLQVPADINLSTFKLLAERAGNTNLKVMELKNLNHLFQHSETGLPSEYGEIEETFSPEALLLIKEWINNLSK